MKSKIISLAFVAIAIIGAFTSNAMNKNRASLALVQGYIKSNPQGTKCIASIICSDIGTQLCMVGTTQVWGKDSAGRCTIEVYRQPN